MAISLPLSLSTLEMFNASLTAPEKCINIRRIPETANKTITMELGRTWNTYITVNYLQAH